MKNIFLAATALAALMVAPSVASAQDMDDAGWYVRGNVGYGAFTDSDLIGDLVGDIEAEGNAAGSLGLGYEFGNNWRLEADASTMWNDMGAISQLPNTTADLRTNNLFLNAIYDFNDFGRWEPYVGAGIGLVSAKLSAATHDFPSMTPIGVDMGTVNVTNAACSPICDFSDKDTGLGWQVLAGLGYDISDNLSWDTHYRYMNATDLDFNGTRSASVGGSSSAISTTLEDLGAHMLMTGFRYKFGAAAPKPLPVVTPPPPKPEMVTCWDGSMAANLGDCPATPPPPPQPTVQCFDGTLVFNQADCPVAPPPPPPVIVEPPQVSICDQGDLPFVVYFEWDKSRLTEQARAVVAQASSVAASCGISNINIEGHADSSGAAAYNVGLSRRRADVVQAELVSQGVQASNITKEARGETALAVQTGDNVREPLNRRTEVLIRLVPTNGLTF